jgi:hypothetical protein
MEKDQGAQRGFGLPGVRPGRLCPVECQYQSDCQPHRQENRNGGAEAGTSLTSAENQTGEATELGEWVALAVRVVPIVLTSPDFASN